MRGDCLATSLIMLGFMDLGWPRVCRRPTSVLSVVFTQCLHAINRKFHLKVMMISVVLCKINEEINYVSIFIKNVVAVAAYSRLASRSEAKFHTKKLSPLVRPCAAAPAQSTTSTHRSLQFSLVNGRESNHSLNQWPSQALSKTKKEY